MTRKWQHAFRKNMAAATEDQERDRNGNRKSKGLFQGIWNRR